MRRISKDERGQILILTVLWMPILLTIAGLAIDVGLLYVTKAKLSQSVDGACLAGMKNLPQGQSVAQGLAQHIFNANFGTNPPPLNCGEGPGLCITFPTDMYGDRQVSVAATVIHTTFFMRVIPQFQNVAVSAKATATRGKLVMSIVLDRSGSMQNNGGAAALQSAIPTFINDFDNNVDNVALISFASSSAVNFPIGSNFQQPIKSAVAAMHFTGGTFGTGGTYLADVGPPIALAQDQNDRVPAQHGQNVTKVMVYFTDGLMNTIQDTFACTNHGNTLYNYGGYDSGSNFDFLSPTDGTDWGGLQGQNPPYPPNSYCAGVTKFYSQQYQKNVSFSRTNITAEAQYRAIQTANAMRAENPGTYIYTIGLGSGVNSSTQAFLQTLANDPANSSTYNPNLPAGLFLYVPDCPSTTCTSELNTAFQTIASKILLRLTQ